MKHKIGFNRLGLKASHREAMISNMITSLFEHERITTTKAKALAVRQKAEKMITRAKSDSVHNRRIVGRRIRNQAILARLFTDIGPRFTDRPGGYTRILKLGMRPGDAAEMVILELVGREPEETTKDTKKQKKEPVKKDAGKKDTAKKASTAASKK